MARDLLAIGVLVALALVCGRLAAAVRVPRITGHLLAGVLLGPSLAHLLGAPALVTRPTLENARFLSQIALALIVFSVGGHFSLMNLRKWLWRVVGLMGFGAVVPFAAVLVATRAMGASTTEAVLLAIVAAETAPAATMMVIREYEADGELTHVITALLALTNLAAIVAFQIATYLIVTPGAPIEVLGVSLGAPIGLGVGAGLVLSYWEQRIDKLAERQLMVLTVLMLVAGAAGVLGVSVLLAALVTGVVAVNASPHDRRVFDDMQLVDYPFYVAFFALAGANLHMELLPQIGVVGFGYVLARAAGKLVGNAVGARVWQFGSIAERWLGVGMLAQAGVAVGFAHQLGESWGAQGKKLEALILAAVLVFEMIGPILTRAALVHGGEVPVLALLSRGAPVGVFEGMHEVIGHIRLALGIPVWRKSNNPAHVLVRHVMRRNVETARDNLPFAKVLQLLGHTRYDRIPVLDASGRLVGQICYADVAGILFDDALSSLVVARDLMTPAPITLATDDTLDKALRVFAASPDVTYVPVVDGADPKRLLGIVRQNDVLAACRRQ